MSDFITKAMAYLDSEEGQASTKKYFDDLAKKDEETKAFFGTARFNDIVMLIKSYISNGGYGVNCESLAYGTHPLADAITSNELWKVQSAITKNDFPTRTDVNADWPTYGVVYDGLLFEVVSGQGSILCVSAATDDCYASKTFDISERVVLVGDGEYVDAVYIDGKLAIEGEQEITPLNILEALGITSRYLNINSDEIKPELNDIEGVTWNTATQS